MTIRSNLAALNALEDIRATITDGEYRVTIAATSLRYRHAELDSKQAAADRAEAIAYYTTDFDDALATAAVISAHFALHGGLKKSDAQPKVAEAPQVRRDNVEYHLGQDAQAAGKTIDQNPYTAGGERAARWALGWNEGAAVVTPADRAEAACDQRKAIRLTYAGLGDYALTLDTVSHPAAKLVNEARSDLFAAWSKLRLAENMLAAQALEEADDARRHAAGPGHD